MTKHDKQTIPSLRFKGFDGEWEEKKLGIVADVRDGTHASPIYQEQGFPLVTSKNLTDYGLDLSNVSFISPKDYDEINKRSKVDKGDILLGLIGTIGKPVLVQQDGYAIKNVGLIKELSEIQNNFLLPLLRSPVFDNYISQKNTGNTQKFLGLDALRNFEFYAPTPPEQTQLGNFFRQLDYRITESRALWEKSRQLKKAMLAKIFPAAGETAPKIRFQGFTGEWERKTLGEISDIVMGQSPSSTSYTNNPNDFILVQGNADMKNGKVCPRVWTTQPTKQGKAGDIVMSVRAPVGDVGKTDYDIVVGRGVCAIKGNEFIYQTLWKMKSDGYWDSISSGSTFESVNSNDVKNTEILIPSPEEQTAIGNFFRQLDDTIALHALETEKLGYLKKALLAAMLV